MGEVLQLGQLTREDVREMAPGAMLVLPTAAIEQHGPHLPLQTDCILVEAVVRAAAQRAAAQVPVVVAPTLPFGNSHHHLAWSALSLRSGTFQAVLNDLADSLVASGFRRIFVVNGHGGNDEGVRLLAKDLVIRAQVAVAACSYWDVGGAANRLSKEGGITFCPGHSGGFETAMMLAVAPDLVRRDRMPTEDPYPPRLTNLGLGTGVTLQKAGDWERIGGYTDAPRVATAELGQRLLDGIAEAVAGAIVSFHRATIEL